MKTNTPEYKKTAAKLKRHKFWKLHPVPVDSELFQRVVNDYQSGNSGGQHPYFNTSDQVIWDEDRFDYSWYCACDTDCDERGYMWIHDFYDKDGKLIDDNDDIPPTPTIQALADRLRELEASQAS